MRGKLHLRGGCILTLGAKTPNLADGDVVVDDGIVAEVGRGLRARDAEVVDATDTIVMPGFVDTHRHAWTSLFRNLGERGGDTPRLTADVRDHYTPDDVYAATLVGLLGAAEAGITTVVDWCDLPLDDASVDALLRAHADSGMRTVVVPASQEPPTRELLTRLLGGAGSSTTVAYGSGQTDLDRLASEWALARELGLRIHAHAGADAPGPGWVAELAERGLLGADVTLVASHGARRCRLRRDRGVVDGGGAHPGERHGRRARRAADAAADRPRASGRGWASVSSAWRPATCSPRCAPRSPCSTPRRSTASWPARAAPQPAQHPRRDPLRHRRRCAGSRPRPTSPDR